MTTRRLATLQWVGLVLGAAVWWTQHILGAGINHAACNVGGAPLGIDHDAWEGGLMAIAVAFVLLAQAAAVTVLLQTRGASYEDPPRIGRIRFFAIAAVVANLLFLAIILLDGIANLADVACRQS